MYIYTRTRRIHGFLLRARLAEQLQQLRMNLSKCKERHQQWRVLISAVVSQSLIHFLQQGKEGIQVGLVSVVEQLHLFEVRFPKDECDLLRIDCEASHRW